MKWIFIFFLTFLACGDDGNFNPNAIFVTDHDEDRVDVLLARATIALDRKKLDKAEELATEAYNRNPDNIDASKLLANVYLSQVNLSVTGIAQRIADDLKVSDSSTASDTDALDVLGLLGDVISLSVADYEILGTRTEPKSSFFTGLPLIYPSEPGDHTNSDSPRNKLKSLRLINKAIVVLCPFISPSVTEGFSDPRHNCSEATNSTVSERAQVNFSFALAHLLEAVHFNSVLMYNENSQASETSTQVIENSHLFKKVKAIENVSFTLDNVTEYSDAVDELLDDINAIYKPNDSNSLLVATMIDLRVANEALSRIEDLPDDLLLKIQGVLTKIQSSVDAAGGTKTDILNQSNALKDQLNTSLVSRLGTSITEFVNKIPATDLATADVDAKVDKVCSSYSSIVDGFLDNTKVDANLDVCDGR